MRKKVFVVVDKDGRGWDTQIGAKFYPDRYISAESARQEARAVNKKFGIETYVIPATLIYKKPILK
jgi:hypothetical protein